MVTRRQLLATGLSAATISTTGLPAIAAGDGVMIQRIGLAPERRVFFVDVGRMSPEATKRALDEVKAMVANRSLQDFFETKIA